MSGREDSRATDNKQSAELSDAPVPTAPVPTTGPVEDSPESQASNAKKLRMATGGLGANNRAKTPPNTYMTRGDYIFDSPTPKSTLNVVSPDNLDCLISDIDNSVLKKSGADKWLNVEYFSPGTFPLPLPIIGRMYGTQLRPLVAMPCQLAVTGTVAGDNNSAKPIINLYFVVDSGSAATYISLAAFKKLLGKPEDSQIEWVGARPKLYIRDRIIAEEVHVSDDNRIGQINLLGGVWLAHQGLSVLNNYRTEEVTIQESTNEFKFQYQVQEGETRK